MSDNRFVHLHCHSHYSLLDGAGRIPDLLDVTQRHGMEALALTDHGNLFGAIEFYTEAKKRGIQPIIGYEAYMAPGCRTSTEREQRAGGYYHMTLLAENLTGYQNLIKLASAAYLEGFYRKPRIDKALLAEHSEGIIALSGCLRSEICYALARDEHELALQALDEYLRIFGEERFFLELQYNGIREQKLVSEALIELADRRGLRCVLTNDVHYPTPESARVHEVLLCIQTNKTLADEKRFRFQTDEFYLKSAGEMAQVFPDRPDAMAATLEIARRCCVELDFKGHHLPPYLPPRGQTVERHFRELCESGLRERYGETLPDEVAARFETEYALISEMGFQTYFLIVQDFIRHAREKGIAVGPGRGSAAGSIISYALRITNIDPLKYDLIFERFLNQGRNELPDIDIDFDAERRGEVIEYVVEKYGRENVCQIITFGTCGAKSGIRDVARVLGWPVARADRLAKMVPEGPGISLQKALEQVPDLQAEYDGDAEVRELIDIARGIEGIVRQTGVHAAGVIIADKPVSSYCPLQRVKEEVTTQFPMEQCGKIGLLKMDFLGLKNLTIIEHALDQIARGGAKRLVMDDLPMDDAETYALLSRGATRGIFQLESSGMREILVKLKPDRFEDIIALVALYRPGPLGSGMVDVYIDCKHGRARPEYLHPMLEELLAETHGVILYQEQVMRIANLMGGFSLSDADRLRKAMGKKNRELMEAYHTQFVAGAVGRGIDERKADEIFQLMAEFAKYGFNKSHSAAYALVAYQTAYLKAHFRREFMAALLTSHAGDTDKVAEYVEECKQEKIPVLPPDVNDSDVTFRAGPDDIRYGLGAIKKCGTKALEAITAARTEGGPFLDFGDLCDRVDTRLVNKAVMANLIRAGACDRFGHHRAQMVAALEIFLRREGETGRAAEQLGLFDDLPEEELPERRLPEVDRWPDRDLLREEKEALGFYLSGHPLAPFVARLARFATTSAAGLAGAGAGREVRVGGLVTRLKTNVVKKGRTAGRKMARFQLEDTSGACSAVAFPEVYETYLELLSEDRMVFLTGQLNTGGTEPELTVSKVVPLEAVESVYATSVLIKLDTRRHHRGQLEQLKQALQGSPGDVPVYLELLTEQRERVYLSTGRSLTVSPDDTLAGALAGLVGFAGFQFKATGRAT